MTFRLTKGQREEIVEIMEEDNGHLSAIEFLETYSAVDLTNRIEKVYIDHNRQMAYEWKAAYIQCLYLDNLHTSRNWHDRGIARRIATDDPAELTKFLSIHSRLRWALDGNPKRSPNKEYYPLVDWFLIAMAIRDWVFARKLAENLPYEEPANFYRKIEYNAMLALVRGDTEVFASLECHFAPKSPPRFYKAILKCFQGVLDQSPEMISDALHQMLASFRRLERSTEIEKIVCLDAHGMYSLCHYINPKLVEEFDVAHKLPWDQKLWERTFNTPEPFKFDFDLSFVSPEFHKIVVELETPPWW